MWHFESRFLNISDGFTVDLSLARCYRLGVISRNEASFGNIGKKHLLKARNTICGTNIAKYFKPTAKYFCKEYQGVRLLFHVPFSTYWQVSAGLSSHFLKNLSRLSSFAKRSFTKIVLRWENKIQTHLQVNDYNQNDPASIFRKKQLSYFLKKRKTSSSAYNELFVKFPLFLVKLILCKLKQRASQSFPWQRFL